jgi:RNA polymerase sigma factor (sigma-70 family)
VTVPAVPSPEEQTPAGPEEEDVQEAIARRDWKGAVTLLMQRYGDSIYRFCRQMTGDDVLAADIHQITFMQAFVDLENFSGRSLVRTWLFSIARHRCIDALKARRRWRVRFTLLELPDGESIDSIDPTPPPDARMSKQELIAALEHCMGRLAPAVRTTVLLRYVEGFSYDEISRVCNERAGTLRTWVARAMPVLRRCVEARGGTIP